MHHKQIGLNMYDSRTRNLPCTPEFSIEFMALMLTYELNAIYQARRQEALWAKAGAFVQNYLNDLRSSTTQDALNNLVKGDINMLLLKPTRPEQIIWNPYFIVGQKVREVRQRFNETIKNYTDEDLFQNVFRELEPELPKRQDFAELYKKAILEVISWGRRNENTQH